jgi:hypothetical protein
MKRLIFGLGFLSTACFSAGWALWCWNDPVRAEIGQLRAVTPEDRASLVVYAVGRIAFIMGLVLWLELKGIMPKDGR